MMHATCKALVACSNSLQGRTGGQKRAEGREHKAGVIAGWRIVRNELDSQFNHPQHDCADGESGYPVTPHKHAHMHIVMLLCGVVARVMSVALVLCFLHGALLILALCALRRRPPRCL
jgi:hypothetical protein